MAYSLRKRSREADLPAASSFDESARRDLRGAAMGASLLGMASMAAVALFQIGAIRHLPDPPVSGFDSDHVNDPERASLWGVPDGFYKLTAHVLTLALARAWTVERTERQPWIALFAGGFVLGQAIAAARSLRRMPTEDKAWCGYRLADALAHFVTAVLMLPTAIDTLRQRMRRR